MTPSGFLSRNRDQRSTQDADQTELGAILNGSAAVDEGVYDERVASSLDDFDPETSVADEGSWEEADLRYDSAVGAVNEEIERRISLLGARYPFQLDRGSLIYTGEQYGLYEFLLAICLAPNITSGEFKELPRLFERVCAVVARTTFREPVESHHVGWPRDDRTSFEASMRAINRVSGEWRWGPDEEVDPAAAKDEGVDFIVWPVPTDARKIGQIFLVGQCACGNDWVNKFDDLNIKNLSKWFNPLSIVDPIRSLATPFFVVDAVVREASRKAGFFFDRGRLYGAETTHGYPAEEQFGDRMRAATQMVFNRLSASPNIGDA
ncbi:MAG: hypothetical protein RIB03_03235 [Henriciella sp.]|uniref:hypothetical protein n=1 Tax=Henriciella sp. TaxID=1968823 RepID=UPI0032EBFB96